ncbi:MAG TPA: hypothetical protein VGI03_03795 [Verrucomicrobiae bacterium]|jgi:hypothetical protein
MLHAERQLLLAESELNRIQLLQDLENLRHEYHRVADTIKSAGNVASSLAKVGGFVLLFRRFFRRMQPSPKTTTESSSLVSELFNGVKTGFSIWQAFRARR